MLKRNYFFSFYRIPVPSFLIIEGVGYVRFKRKNEIKSDIFFFWKKFIALFKKECIYWNGLSAKTLSSFEKQIEEKGGIVDCNGGIHTTSESYKNFLKDNGLVIKDWSDGSNKPKQQLSDKAEIAKIVNKYI